MMYRYRVTIPPAPANHLEAVRSFWLIHDGGMFGHSSGNETILKQDQFTLEFELDRPFKPFTGAVDAAYDSCHVDYRNASGSRCETIEVVPVLIS